jgi:ABC-2 type transport system ATP-binding protein
LFALDPKEKAVRSKQLLDMVGLTATQMRTVGEFSKGMQRRIGLAQALINDPDLVILDEPTSGLDPVGCREIKDLILNLKARGKTVILSSHLLSDVEDVCDRAVIYYGGKIQQYGTLEELLTERDTIRFTLPALSEEAQQEVMDTIGKHVGAGKVRVENPTQNLESFFLNVVENAIAKDEDTSGSTAGNEVAEFLRADDPVPTQAETMLERLADKGAAQPAATQEEHKPEEPKVDTAKLESLAGDEAPKQLAKPKQAETKKSQNLDDAEDKLSGLLGGE